MIMFNLLFTFLSIEEYMLNNGEIAIKSSPKSLEQAGQEACTVSSTGEEKTWAQLGVKGFHSPYPMLHTSQPSRAILCPFVTGVRIQPRSPRPVPPPSSPNRPPGLLLPQPPPFCLPCHSLLPTVPACPGQLKLTLYWCASGAAEPVHRCALAQPSSE